MGLQVGYSSFPARLPVCQTTVATFAELPIPSTNTAMPNESTITSPAASNIQSVFESQSATALRLRSSTAGQRIEKLRCLRDAVLAHTDDLYDAAHADFKKPKGEVDLAEILPVCAEANDAISHLKQWMKPKRVWPTLLTAGTRSHVQYMPRGRCLIISPWKNMWSSVAGPSV